MRFLSLTLEKYGLIDSRTLSFPESPGLVVIHGPNEAGKSTSLEAISDFLYGLPANTARGGVFGYDGIRLSATLALADGTSLSLKRRKGRIRTLTDADGEAVDEAVLTRILGSTDRLRFQSLFGLDHLSLRSGGEHLLAADGDIGRLILEAGGGLRSLVEIIDGLGVQASGLFDTRKKADRLFYIGLTAFEAADRAVKDGVMTREAFEQARKHQKDAQDRVAELRLEQQRLRQETLHLERLVRVVPSIQELDGVAAELTAFAGLRPLGEDFAGACEAALKALTLAEEGLAEAEARSRTVQAKIDAIVPPQALLDAEAAIRDAGEKAVHVGKARADRANREAELAELDRKLEAVRAAVGLGPDAELAALAPPPDAIALAQKLASQGIERRGKIAGLAEERARVNERLEAIGERQEKRRAAGTHEPFGIGEADFADLARLTASVETRDRQAAKLKSEIEAKLGLQGFKSIDELAAWSCPGAAVIQAEIDRRNAIEIERIRILDRIATETEKHGNAAAEILRLAAGGEVPSALAIGQARAARDRIWNEIKSRYLSPDGAGIAARPLPDRLADADQKQAHTKLADGLADRKSSEADRVAALDLAQRQKSAAATAQGALTEQRTGLDGQLTAAIEAWRLAWPEATLRVPDLGRLKTLSEERIALLAQHAGWQALADEAETQKAEIAPRLAALSQAEARLDLPSTPSLAERIAAAIKGIKLHDDAYADYRQDEIALDDLRLRTLGIGKAQDELAGAEQAWLAQWEPAMRALGLGETAAPESANEIATQWAAAAGLLVSFQNIRKRLSRMDEDEDALLALVRSIAPTLDFPLPEDAAAAARMLMDRLEDARKAQIGRESLILQRRELAAEGAEKKRRADEAAAAVEALCAEGACERPALIQLAARCRERSAVTARLAAIGEEIVKLGDGLSVERLREDWGNRDLVEIKAGLLQLASEGIELDGRIEAALAERDNHTRELAELSASAGVNAAVAERERATAEMHGVLERYIETVLAEDLLRAAMDRVREQRKDPLIIRAGALFAAATAGAFAGVETDIDDKGNPVVAGRRANGERVPVAIMSDGVRDQLFLSFRIASIEQYCRAAEPLPFIADDLLVHFDDDRGVAALELLAELGRTTQVLAFTHHRHLRDDALPLAEQNRAAIIDL